MKFLLFIPLFALCFTAYGKETVDKVVASVNDEIILLSDLKSMDGRLKRIGSVDETLLLGEKIADLKSNPRKQLDFLVREKLVDSEVKRQSMTISDEQVTAEMNQLAKKNQMNDAEFSDYMSSQGYTVSQYKEVLRKRMERQRFFEKEIISKLRITDEDAYGVFQARFPKYRPSVGEYKIAQIFFSSRKGGEDEARLRAQAALEKLKAGESFESLANQLDETPGSNKDGVLGVFRSGEFSPALEKAVENLSINDTTPIVAGPTGFHIVKLLDKKTIRDPNFERVKEQIKSGLVQQNFERQLKNWFELKEADAQIKIFTDSAPRAAGEAAPAEAAPNKK